MLIFESSVDVGIPYAWEKGAKETMQEVAKYGVCIPTPLVSFDADKLIS